MVVSINKLFVPCDSNDGSVGPTRWTRREHWLILRKTMIKLPEGTLIATNLGKLVSNHVTKCWTDNFQKKKARIMVVKLD